jgi:hypothetical protein
MDVIQALPRDTSHVRHDILFNLPMPFSLSRVNHERFWSLINNVYVIRKSRDVGLWKRDYRPAHQWNHVECRFRRSRDLHEPSASQGIRASGSKRVKAGCDVTFNLLAFLDYYEYWPIGQSGDLASITCTQHLHSLDESDANKRNSLLRQLVGAEVAKSYHPAVVIGSLRGEGLAKARD